MVPSLPVVRHRLLLAAAVVTGCLDPNVYPCVDDTQCLLDGQPGICAGPGYCAYEDDGCGTGLRFGPSADAFSNQCVSAGFTGGQTTGELGSESIGTDSASGTSVGDCDGPCDDPPGPCYAATGTCDAATSSCIYEPLPAGSACGGGDDPCLLEGTCNENGTCEAQMLPCDEPPNDCFEPQGVCDPQQGGCVYTPTEFNTNCEDGDACTLDDRCDGFGVCEAGDVCPTDNPCAPGVCGATGCVFDPLIDGTSCGPRPADRCCGGQCVDIASDDEHCGGCSSPCVQTQQCESVDMTACSPAPADTTGRCTCAANSECPNGQICRNIDPGAFRCAPQGPRDCPANNFVDVADCPNYCAY